MIAFVRLVMRCAMSAGSMLYVRASMSANTTVAPVYRIAFAEAMNVNDGTMTSSPGPTPAVASARCRPVVQEVVAIPCFAPTYDATAFSNSATFGPWVTHPLLIASYGARASSSPSDGFVIGTLSFFFASLAIRQDLFPPFDEPAHAVFERRGRFETEQVARPPRIAHPPRGKRALRLWRELHPDGAAGETEEERGEVTHRRLDPAADVHDSRRGRGLAREQVRPSHVFDVHEVHRRGAVPVQGERLAFIDQVQPADHDLDEARAHVHPRAIHVEVAEGRRPQSIQVSERPCELLVRDLHRAVERGAVQWLVLVDRQRLRLAVHDGARREDDVPGLRRDRGGQDVERAVHHDLVAFARGLLAPRPAKRRLVEHEVRAVDGGRDGLAVPDVDLAQARLARPESGGKVVGDATHERVERDDLARPGVDGRGATVNLSGSLPALRSASAIVGESGVVSPGERGTIRSFGPSPPAFPNGGIRSRPPRASAGASRARRRRSRMAGRPS